MLLKIGVNFQIRYVGRITLQFICTDETSSCSCVNQIGFIAIFIKTEIVARSHNLN